MLKVKAELRSEIVRGEVNTCELEFDNVRTLEDWLSYNRANIKALEMSGEVSA